LLPLRVVIDGTRGGAYLTVAVAGIGMFGLFLFLTYYLTTTLGFSPVRTGAAFLPMLAAIMVSAIAIGSVLVPKVGPRPLVPAGALIAAAGMALLTRVQLDSSYLTVVLPALLVMGLGLGLVFAPAQNAATSGVRPADAGVASAMINTAQQIGGALGTALLSTFAASSASSVLSGKVPTAALAARAALHSYHTVFWWSTGILVACSVLAAVLFRPGPLQVDPDAAPALAH
jgi:predicted MFS family arabinose efflux permease